MSKTNKLKILWHSVAGYVKSGYGKVTNEVTSRLVKEGFQVVVSAYYGLEPGGSLIINGVPTLPSKEGMFGKDSCLKHFRMLNMDAAILHTDWWAFPWFPQGIPINILYSPMDHANYPLELHNLTRQFTYVISLCKWQRKELEKSKIESIFIPHGVDTKVYKPINQNKAREVTGMPIEKFIIGIVGANSDKEGRKGWAPMFKAIKYFREQNPDVKDLKVVAHTNPYDGRGLPLHLFAHKQGLDDVISFANPALAEVGLKEDEMAMLYNCFDLLLHASMREGFGLCILEAVACGTPAIVTDFSSMTELVKGHGWLVKNALKDLNTLTTPINADTGLPDVYDIARCLKDAYFHPKKLRKYGKKSREFALKYDWDKVVKNSWIPFLKKIGPKPIDIKDKRYEEVIKI